MNEVSRVFNRRVRLAWVVQLTLGLLLIATTSRANADGCLEERYTKERFLFAASGNDNPLPVLVFVLNSLPESNATDTDIAAMYVLDILKKGESQVDADQIVRLSGQTPYSTVIQLADGTLVGKKPTELLVSGDAPYVAPEGDSEAAAKMLSVALVMDHIHEGDMPIDKVTRAYFDPYGRYLLEAMPQEMKADFHSKAMLVLSDKVATSNDKMFFYNIIVQQSDAAEATQVLLKTGREDIVYSTLPHVKDDSCADPIKIALDHIREKRKQIDADMGNDLVFLKEVLIRDGVPELTSLLLLKEPGAFYPRLDRLANMAGQDMEYFKRDSNARMEMQALAGRLRATADHLDSIAKGEAPVDR